MTLSTTIGLEVHVQLKTKSKMFCACSTAYGAPPNTHVCPVCLGYPGVLPVMNEEAIRLTVISGLMTGCRISEFSKFDRKSYFYPDMPKNYQISQYDKPLCEDGSVSVPGDDGSARVIHIKRIHLEEDVAKSMHFHTTSGVDFNRAGVPLMEIVTEPDIRTPQEALAFLQALKEILMHAGVSDCNLEEGNIRCDANCSLRPAGQKELGTKTEIKNLNTFKGVLHALEQELSRQKETLEAGGRVEQETRRWDADAGTTFVMRTKEDAHDYRYFPDPDLVPVILSKGTVDAWLKGLPELPAKRRERLVREYGLPDYDAGVLVADRAVADFYEAAARLSPNPKAVSNWVMTELLRMLAEEKMDVGQCRIRPEALAGLVRLVDEQVLNSSSAKEVFAALFESGGDPRRIVEERGMAQVSDTGAMERLVDQAMAENAKSVADYRAGKTPALKFLVGQVMKASKGKANPRMVQELLERRLGVE